MKIDWTFNSPYASHTGGVWERMIRLVRQIFLAVTPMQTLRDDDLATFFVEVEAIVNSRPLTDVPLEVGEPTPLSPNHLLRVNAAVAKPFMLTDESDNYARQRFRIVQYAADKFWQRWLLEYPKTCMGNLLSLGAKMCIWNFTEGRSRNCDFKCNLGTYFCGVWIVFM